MNDEQGFEAFVRRRGRDLWRSAWLLTGDGGRAEDLVQTALAKTYPRYDGNDRSFEAYVRTTIYRTFVSWWRRRWTGEVPSERMPEPGPDGGSAPAVDLNEGLRIDVLRALAELPRAQRAVLVLRYFEDLPIAEVAELLGLAQGTVKAYSHRALEQLRGSVHLEEQQS
ncbi:MAG: SigE family RNA polymerase sigma factor [Tessaracoccus sp.]|uniref:SigE family RNA polymerase sigma factor n=1 Tax=Tessaracoccus sp. TaxID=1971211 RepID=UPI001EB5E5A4|nr:SigE family RNA polymerase sigma factor [Tessaracoccus sp.]MBK7820177.1 SigE family RNA polymerase sigma factor [Tessaracoccus sp.]